MTQVSEDSACDEETLHTLILESLGLWIRSVETVRVRFTKEALAFAVTHHLEPLMRPDILERKDDTVEVTSDQKQRYTATLRGALDPKLTDLSPKIVRTILDDFRQKCLLCIDDAPAHVQAWLQRLSPLVVDFLRSPVL